MSVNGNCVQLLKPETLPSSWPLFLSHLSISCGLHVENVPSLTTFTVTFLVEAASSVPGIAANCFCPCQHLLHTMVRAILVKC